MGLEHALKEFWSWAMEYKIGHVPSDALLAATYYGAILATCGDDIPQDVEGAMTEIRDSINQLSTRLAREGKVGS